MPLAGEMSLCPPAKTERLGIANDPKSRERPGMKDTTLSVKTLDVLLGSSAELSPQRLTSANDDERAGDQDGHGRGNEVSRPR